MPANNGKYTAKAPTLPADVIILDLEDGVLEDQKVEARRLAVEIAECWPPYGPKLFLRINPPGSRWFADDFAVLRVPSWRGVLMPKAEGNGDISEFLARARDLEVMTRADGHDLELILCIESPRSLFNAHRLARISGVAGLTLGLEDLARELALSPDGRLSLQTSEFTRAMVSFAARGEGKISFDCLYPKLNDDEGLRADTVMTRNLGFDGKGTFHPSHLEAINEVMSPSPNEIVAAEEIVRSYEEAVSRGGSTAYAAGQLVDLPVVLRARRTLASAQMGLQILSDQIPSGLGPA
jgi:citrate lyase beta subunit